MLRYAVARIFLIGPQSSTLRPLQPRLCRRRNRLPALYQPVAVPGFSTTSQRQITPRNSAVRAKLESKNDRRLRGRARSIFYSIGSPVTAKLPTPNSDHNLPSPKWGWLSPRLDTIASVSLSPSLYQYPAGDSRHEARSHRHSNPFRLGSGRGGFKHRGISRGD